MQTSLNFSARSPLALAYGYTPRLTAVNHWPTAVATHSTNHPDARHLCASLDSLNPRV